MRAVCPQLFSAIGRANYTSHRRILSINKRKQEIMELNRIQRILNSFMAISFLIFVGLAGYLFLRDISLSNQTVALPFAFLYLSAVTLITTARIGENPDNLRDYLRGWVAVCAFGTLISALAFMVP
jgi:hypothetical protein